MKMYKSCPLYFFLFVFSCLTFFNTNAQLIEIESVFNENFENHVGIEYSHEGSSLIYIVRRDGQVQIKDINNPDIPSSTFIDISDRVLSYGELGLLGLAFSPDYPEDNRFYLYYAYEENGEYFSTLARYSVSDGVGDPDSEERLFELLQPQDNHNGGQLTFGPDGYLYIALGDGGRSSRFLAQDTEVLNGSILRIDVRPETGYAIPSDNPFVEDSGGLDEIYAWGFRNPWRISFDSLTGELWVADVGLQGWESIYIIDKGKNYGWPIVEGSHCLRENCDKEGLEMPLFEYPWGEEDTGRSITGGYVYRGELNPSLYGKYIYGDFISKKIWALEVNHNTREVISNTEIAKTEQNIPSFGVDSAGELYIGGWSGASSNVYRFAPELTLTTLALKNVGGSNSVQLEWEVNSDSGIDSFELFRGSSIDDMELYETIGGDNRQYSDPDPLDGATFYAIRAVESDGDAGELSNPVSFYRGQETLGNSWQLTSIPFETEGVSVSNAIIYKFDGSYVQVDQIEPGYGYWTRSTVEGGVEFTGEGAGLQSVTIHLKRGWNLIGAPISALPVGSIIDEGSILNSTPIYGFNGSVLTEAESISPGQGYWIYADEAGEITIDLELESVNLPLASASAGKENDSVTFDTFEFNSANSSTKLYVAKRTVDPEVRNRFRVPPLSPDPALDVRTSDGFKLVESSRFEPEITASEYPLSMKFTPGERANNFTTSDPGDIVYEVTVWRDGVSESLVLKSGNNITLSEPVERIEFLRVESQNEIVRETELLPSYPNPFNPVTNITYRLSEQQQVTLIVFDAAGRRIATLVESEQEAGQYTLPFDASGLASGIYFVRFSAGDLLSTQKLTLIK